MSCFRIAMSRPALYNASNMLQRESVRKSLADYTNKIKWKQVNHTAIDLGCGDGSATVMVKKLAPYPYKKFVACDVSESMVKFASERYGGEDITFKVMDIGGDFPEDFKGAFSHVFSFYALHWVKDQEKAFKNIYSLMSDDGDCFMTMIGRTDIYSIYNILAHHPKWKTWLKEVDVFVSPYHEIKDPHTKVAAIMEKCGFKSIDVTTQHFTSVFDNVKGLTDTVKSIEPFRMPKEVFEDFVQDYLRVGEENGFVVLNKNDKNETTSVTYQYSLIVMYANK